MKRIFIIIWAMYAPVEQQDAPELFCKVEMQDGQEMHIKSDLTGILFAKKTRYNRYAVYFSDSEPTVYIELPKCTTYVDSKALCEIFAREHNIKPLYRTDVGKSHATGSFETIPMNLQQIEDFWKTLRNRGLDNCGVKWMVRGSFSGDDDSEDTDFPS